MINTATGQPSTRSWRLFRVQLQPAKNRARRCCPVTAAVGQATRRRPQNWTVASARNVKPTHSRGPRAQIPSGHNILGGLAGNATRLGTPDRHTFPPDGKPRASRLANIYHTVSVAPTSRLRRSRARSPVSSPEHFAWMGTLFGRKDTHKPWINYFFEWNVVDELAANVLTAPGLREMTMAEGKPNFRVVERLKIKIGEWFFCRGTRECLEPSFRVLYRAALCCCCDRAVSGAPPPHAMDRGDLLTQFVQPGRLSCLNVTIYCYLLHRWCKEFRQRALNASRRTLYDNAWPRRNIPHSNYWESNRVSTPTNLIFNYFLIYNFSYSYI